MDDYIAIVGMVAGCRLPGDVKSMPQFWELLSTGRSAQSDVPENRFNIKNWYHPDPKRYGGIASKGGYFLSQDDSFRQFDASFFGIHPLEASTVDPQQRKLLEVVFETFESAGVTLDKISGSRTACYVGAFTHDYKTLSMRDTENYAPYMSTGSDLTVLSNRINYVFNLKGPSLTVDTACSSSLYALHLACQGLRCHDFDGAVVAGTNIVMDVGHQIVATKLGILSPTSTCHTFDDGADGFGRAEGITAIYIKRLGDALNDRDPIRAIIRASAINTNGKGLGITHPGSSGQEDVIRQAHMKAGVDFDETCYVECHGTGTPVGDPIEVEAIGRCFADSRTSDNALLLSAVKSQIGHTEGASGLAGVQKAVLSMEKGMIPATIGIKRVNPSLNLRHDKLRIVRRLEQWPSYLNYTRVSVNSFGYGGANAHVILDGTQSFLTRIKVTIPKSLLFRMTSYERQAAALQADQDTVSSQRSLLLVTSAHSKESLMRNTKALTNVIPDYQTADLAFTLGLNRSHFHHRGYRLVAATGSNDSLADWKCGATWPKPPTIAFVFTGQGAQWPQMGIELFRSYDVVRRTFEDLQKSLDTIPERPEWTLYEALNAEPEKSLMMKSVVISVTLCTAIQIALVDLLRSWRIAPTAVVGHSSGEAAAAYCAGYLTMAETIVTSYYRALSLQRNPQPGLMMAAGLSISQAQEIVSSHKDLYLACRNSPKSVTIAGLPNAVEDLEEKLRSAGTFARIVKSSGFANHSPLVQTAAAYFIENFSNFLPESSILAARIPSAPFYSCITGGRVDCVHVDTRYWSQNIAAPVLFDKALESLMKTESSVDLLIELGPHSALAGPIRQIKDALGSTHAKTEYLPTMKRGSNNAEDLLNLAGALFNLGYPIDLEAVNNAGWAPDIMPQSRLIVDLPTYQWSYAKEINMVEERQGNTTRFRKHPRHDLLGTYEFASTPDVMIWRNKLNLKETPWIMDHVIGTSILFPASGYATMAIEAMAQLSHDLGQNPGKYELWNMDIMKPLVLSQGTTVELIFEMTVSTMHDGGRERFIFKVSSVTQDNRWIQYAKGECGLLVCDPASSLQRLFKVEDTSSFETSIDIYSHFRRSGLRYGPCFRTLHNLQLLPDSVAQADINLFPTLGYVQHESHYPIHPATLDGCLQAAFGANMSPASMGKPTRAFLPNQITYLRVSTTAPALRDKLANIVSRVDLLAPHSISASFKLVDNEYKCFVEGTVRLAAADGISAAQKSIEAVPEPYQRCIWMSDIDHMTGSIEVDEVTKLLSKLQSSTENKSRNHIDEKQHPITDTRTNGHLPTLAGSVSQHHLLPFTKSTNSDILSTILRLIAFKRPTLKYVDVGTDTQSVQPVLESLNAKKRNPSYAKLTFVRNQEPVLAMLNTALRESKYPHAACVETIDEEVDVIVISGILGGVQGLRDCLAHYKRFHVPSGLLLIACPTILASLSVDEIEACLKDAGYPPVKLHTNDMSIVVADNTTSEADIRKLDLPQEYWVVYQRLSPRVSFFLKEAESCGLSLKTLCISDIARLPAQAHVMSLLEIEDPFLMCMEEQQLGNLQKLFSTASSIEWISDTRPELSLLPGMAMTLRVEIPLLTLRCIQIDSAAWNEAPDTAATLLKLLSNQSERTREDHVVVKGRRVLAKRYIVDEIENLYDTARSEGIIEHERFNSSLRLATPSVGQVDSYKFIEEKKMGCSILQPNRIRVQPLIYGFSAENLSTLLGQNQERWYSGACLGRVLEVADHTDLKPGDFVLHLGGTSIGGEQIWEESSCIRSATEAEGRKFVTFLDYFCIAYRALIGVGQIQQGQRVLLHSNDDMLTNVVKVVATHLGATVISSADKDWHKAATEDTQLNGYSLSSTKNRIYTAPKSLRIAVIMDTVGDLQLQSISHILAPNCKLLQVGSTSKFSLSSADISWIKKGVSISYFDIMELAESEPAFMGEILAKAIELARETDVISSLPNPTIFSVADLSEAVHSITSEHGPSRVGLSCDANAIVPVHRFLESSFQLSSDGTYLLVGCLGGLGRSITNWMLAHGARHFIFLSRSGADKLEANQLLQSLQSRSTVTVQVIRGDVTVRDDVRTAVQAALKPIRGVIQAATTFDECSFKTMDIERFDKVIRPKVQGTIHLHEETLNQPLDFFVMTSSSIGLAAATTQSHYTAANAFLDSFAAHRRSLYLPACSLSLGMVVGVGHVHDEGLEELLHRRGGYGITEDEFLRMMELACSNGRSQSSYKTSTDIEDSYSHDTSLVITGLDPTKFAEQGSYPEWAEDDPTFSHIGCAIKRLLPESTAITALDPSSPLSTLRTLLQAQNADEDQISHALQLCIMEKLSSLILIPVEELEDSLHKPLSDLGLDSIISADFQGWAKRELRVSIDFMEILAGNQTIVNLTQMVVGRLVKERA